MTTVQAYSEAFGLLFAVVPFVNYEFSAQFRGSFFISPILGPESGLRSDLSESSLLSGVLEGLATLSSGVRRFPLSTDFIVSEDWS